MIEVELSESSYDIDNTIVIVDERITPESFRGLFLKVWGTNVTTSEPFSGYMALDYFMVFLVSIAPESAEVETPILLVEEGGLQISDTNRILLGLAELQIDYEESGGDVQIALAVLVTASEG